MGSEVTFVKVHGPFGICLLDPLDVHRLRQYFPTTQAVKPLTSFALYIVEEANKKDM